MQYLITPLLEVLNPTNTVSRNRLLSFAIGNAEAEIYNCLIAKHVYYNNLGKLTEGGWFYSTVKDLHLSSGYAENACSADYGGTRSGEARGKTKDNKNQSNCFSYHSFSPYACNEKILNDGMKTKSKLSFLEILSAMGLDLDDWHYIYTRDPTSERDLVFVDEEESMTKTLHIPESFRSDSSYVLTALQYLSAYSNYAFDDDMKPMPNKNFIDITLKMLTEFIMADSFRFNGQIIGYKKVLDTLNSLIRENSLYDFILSFQYEWEKILREKTESSIRNKAAYMKVCLWDWLKRWKIEEYNQLVGLV